MVVGMESAASVINEIYSSCGSRKIIVAVGIVITIAGRNSGNENIFSEALIGIGNVRKSSRECSSALGNTGTGSIYSRITTGRNKTIKNIICKFNMCVC